MVFGGVINMLFQWIVGIAAVVTFVVVGFSDSLAGKSKHSTYYERVQKPAGKEHRSANIPNSSKHDSFYSKLNLR